MEKTPIRIKNSDITISYKIMCSCKKKTSLLSMNFNFSIILHNINYVDGSRQTRVLFLQQSVQSPRHAFWQLSRNLEHHGGEIVSLDKLSDTNLAHTKIAQNQKRPSLSFYPLARFQNRQFGIA